MAKKKGKSKPKQKIEAEQRLDSSTEAITCAPSFVKLCRLCENKEGPFLNIFDGDKITARKLEELMPFVIAENDDLSHKICFRCSAKVEELYEFLQKCIKTQHNLHTAIGKTSPLMKKTKTKERLFWEEHLNKSNMSHDDICDAVVKKAMQSIIQVTKDPSNDQKSENLKITPEDSKIITSLNDVHNMDVKIIFDHNTNNENSNAPSEERIIPSRSCRSRPVVDLNNKSEVSPVKIKKAVKVKQTVTSEEVIDLESDNKTQEPPPSIQVRPNAKKNNINVIDLGEVKENKKEVISVKPFNIMDHVSTIKVNGVGVLYQCQLCNRNFLSKSIVRAHRCAKNQNNLEPKSDVKDTIIPEPPKPPTIKYINTNKPESSTIVSHDNSNDGNTSSSSANISFTKPKPKIGPASKIKPKPDDDSSLVGMVVKPIVEKVQTPTIPTLNSPYKLVRGVNNIYTLVEDHPSHKIDKQEISNITSEQCHADERGSSSSTKKNSKKRKQDASDTDTNIGGLPKRLKPSESQPYPVGLFQTVSQYNAGNSQEPAQDPVVFSTLAAKKQQYTIVQTDNPSKLLISVNPKKVQEEPKQRKRDRKSSDLPRNSEVKQPFSITLQDKCIDKDPNLFTFINVDPLLQPSYVLPTNIIQELQVSTSDVNKSSQSSSNSDRYTCNMCGEKFNREQKLLNHINSHYNKIDEDDLMRERNSKRKGKKSGA